MKALTDVRRTAGKPWSGKLPPPRASPMMTLGDCAVRAGSGRRSVIGGTLTQALQQLPSPSPAMGTAGDRVQIQTPRDPISPHGKETAYLSENLAGSGGPRDEDQRGPRVQIGT